MLLRGPANRWATRSPLRAKTPTTKKPEILKETLAKTPLYDLGAGRKIRPLFDSLCQRATVRNQDQGAYQPRSGQPVGRRRTQGADPLGDAGQWRSVYMPAILKIERSHP